MTKIISIANHKGGVGKTASTIGLGIGLAKLGRRVLLVDMDPQANLTQSLGIADDNPMNIYGLLKGDYKLGLPAHREGVNIIPSTLDLSGAELELASVAGREFILKEILEEFKDQYDYILIDCPPSLGLLSLNAFVASDRVYIPVQSHYLPVKGLVKLEEVLALVKSRLNDKLELGGIFATLYDSRTILHKESAKAIAAQYPALALETKIRQTIAIAEAPISGESIYSYAPDSNGAADYLSLAKELIAREE